MLDVLANAGGLKRSVGFRVPEAGLSLDRRDRLRAVGSALSGPAARPPHLHVFPGVRRSGAHRAEHSRRPAGLHIRADRMDLCFELAQRLTEALGDGGRP